MTLKEILMHNRVYEVESKAINDKLALMKASIQNINTNLNLDDVKQLSYQEAKEIRKLLHYNICDQQIRIDLESIVQELKEKEYPQLKKAHYYPVINEMDFLNDEQKNKLDNLLSKLYGGYIYTESSDWYRLRFNKETTDKVFSFLHDKGIVEKSYIIKCDCGESDCNRKRISQARYDEFVNFHKSDKEEMTWDDDCKGYIEVGCWNGGDKEIYDLDTFMREVKLFAYKCIVKPDTSLENI